MRRAAGVVEQCVADQLPLPLDATPPGTYRHRGRSSLQRLLRTHLPELLARYEAAFASLGWAGFTDRGAALKRACEETPFPIGVIYRNDGRKSFEESLAIYRRDPRPLVERSTPMETVRELLREKS
jgi:hypothetical protein